MLTVVYRWPLCRRNSSYVLCCWAGTVCILAADSTEGQAAVDRIRSRYHQQTGYKPAVFVGSSDGALKQEVLLVKGNG